MPGSAATTINGANDVIESLDLAALSPTGDSELRNEWKQLVIDMRSTRFETDLEERHSERNLERAIRLALTHPDVMSISTKPLNRRHDMAHHVRQHFDSLLNDDDHGASLKRGRPDVELLLNACELAYLYDAVYRFAPETIVHPEIEGLEDVRFIALPDALSRWMGDLDIVWEVLMGDLHPEEPTKETIKRLYNERDEFVTTAKEMEIFLPIRAEYTDAEEERRKVEKRLMRSGHVPPEFVHNYCFSRAVDLY